MSGGHFDYQQYRIGEIASEVQRLIETNECAEKDSYGQEIGRFYSKEVIERFAEAIECLQKAQVYAQRIDWLVSGDDGPDGFISRLADDLRKIDHEQL